MKFIKYYGLIFLFICFNGMSQPQELDPKSQMVLDEIVAKVENLIIMRSEVEKLYLEFSTREDRVSEDTRCKALENLVVNKVMVARASVDSVIVRDDEVEGNLDRRMQYFIGQIGSEEKLVEYYGKTVDQFKNELRESIREQMVVQKMEAKLTSEIKVTPHEVNNFFKKIPVDSLPFFSTEVVVGQIVRTPKANPLIKEEAKKQLLSLRDRILEGEDFYTLAKEYSQDPSAQRNNGELGFFRRGDLDPRYEATSLSLKPGEISNPIESSFGIHIIQLVEKRGNLYNTRHILFIPRPSKEDFDKERYFLDSIRTLILKKEITFEKAAKMHSTDKETGNTGGFLQDQTGGSRVSVEKIDPNLFFVLDTMQAGTISAPIDYRLEDGSESLRIIYYKEKIAPHQANLHQDFQKIYEATLASKKNKIIADWFKEINKNVYIDIHAEFESCKVLK